MPPTMEARKERLFARLNAVYAELSLYNRHHSNTGYGCRQSGRCCQVGLELHWMECEHIARRLEAEFAADPSARPRRIAALKRALDDEAWTAADGFGDFMCAFFDDGCSVYGFRPAVCRMYGPLLPVDDECPRERVGGQPFVYYGADVDRVVRDLYAVLDAYGRLTGKDRSIYVASGVLSFLLSPRELAALKRRTSRKFWRSSSGYRTQFKPERSTVRDLAKAEREAAKSPFVFLPRRPAHP